MPPGAGLSRAFLAPSCPCATERPPSRQPTPPVHVTPLLSRRGTLSPAPTARAAQPIGLTMTNARDRQRYAADPVYRAKRLAKNHEWHAANRDSLNEERRNRYATDPDYRAKVLASNRKKRREHNLRRLYGLSLEDYAAMLRRQGGTC